MKPIITILDERLAQVGSTVDFNGHADEKDYCLGAHTFELPEGIDYSLVLTNAGQGILVSGMVRASVRGVCDRCLDTATFSIASEVDEYYLFEEPEVHAALDDDEDVYELVGADNTIDLTSAINSSLLMETPYTVLCSDTCQGLCCECGQNLNQNSCPHMSRVLREDEALRASSPFSELAALKDKLVAQEAAHISTQDS